MGGRGLPRPCLVHGLVHTREPQRLRPKDHNRLCLGINIGFAQEPKLVWVGDHNQFGWGTKIGYYRGPKMVMIKGEPCRASPKQVRFMLYMNSFLN